MTERLPFGACHGIRADLAGALRYPNARIVWLLDFTGCTIACQLVTVIVWRPRAGPSAASITDRRRFHMDRATWSRATRQVNDTSQRPRSKRTVALRMRAVPTVSRRANLRVDS